MLKLSKKWSYAVKAVIYIAVSWEWLVRVWDIAKDEDISESLLRRIISDLEKVHILETHKWRNGGVKLWKLPNQISTYDILESIGEELSITDCTRWMDCDKHSSCSTTNLFWSLQNGFNTLLKIYTLDKILKNR
jgi:Rrf2 family transcriptional regulator, iron-responsive regulator